MKVKGLVSALILAAACVVTGCKSSSIEAMPDGINPLALLSDDSSIYINIPVAKHKNLVADILCAQMDGLSRKDALKLADHTGHMYAGIGTVKDRSRLEASASVAIPKIAVGSVFKKKNGWFSNAFTSENGSKFTIFSRIDTDLKLSLPSLKVLCVSKNVETLVENYSIKKELEDTPFNTYLNQESDDILFYITRPGQYLRNLIGVTVQGADQVYGTLAYKPDPKNPKADSKKYTLNFYMHLQNKNAMKAFQGMLLLSFGMSDGTVEQIDELTLKVSGVEISEKQVTQMFVRAPITGTHYKVVGDNVYAESKQ